MIVLSLLCMIIDLSVLGSGIRTSLISVTNRPLSSSPSLPGARIRGLDLALDSSLISSCGFIQKHSPRLKDIM